MAGNGGRAEAERWLSIAEKLLAARDLHGSKTFAVRARESDPRLDGSDRILAVVDTLLAGAARINNQHDWYAVLQLASLTQDPAHVTTQYARLASLLSPTGNTLPFADQAFKLVSDAYSVLSNPSKKSLYDHELSLFSESMHDSQPKQAHNKQPQTPVRRSPRCRNNIPEDEPVPTSAEPTQTNVPSFWTACPYCYNLYEYPKVYEECTLRCQNCRRAFHAVMVPPPPGIGAGRDSYFCCWAFFPLGFSVPSSQSSKNTNGSSNWVPFSPMFACPFPGDDRSNAVRGEEGNRTVNNISEGNRNVQKPKNTSAATRRVAKVLVDEDEDAFMEGSDPSDDSDDEWDSNSNRKKKKVKTSKGRILGSRGVKKWHGEKAKKGSQSAVPEVKASDIEIGSGIQGGLGTAETGKKVVGSNTKRQPGKIAKELGKLDLNVEFSNEVEEAAPPMNGGNGAGNGEEDGIAGIGFFEGLDEFLSSLPILSVVGDEKVKAAE